jgi:hypothetical protein
VSAEQVVNILRLVGIKRKTGLDSEPFSRLLTTAMLPKLASIHKRATLVFIIATNHVGQFDLAIRRRGRFDRVVQIMPPTYKAKMAKVNWGPARNLNPAAKIGSGSGVRVVSAMPFGSALADVIDGHAVVCYILRGVVHDDYGCLVLPNINALNPHLARLTVGK